MQVSGSLFDSFPSRTQAGPFARTKEIHERTNRVKFDAGYGWGKFPNMLRHLHSEVREFGETVMRGEPPARQLDELGDVLYISSLMAARQQLDPEAALHHAADKFINRYQIMEQIAQAKHGSPALSHLSATERKQLWNEAKRRLQGA